MACARPVVSVPSGSIKRLIDEQMTGFLFPNDTSSWATFFQALPSRERLHAMGGAAARSVESITWANTAEQYWETCEPLVRQKLPVVSARSGAARA